MSKKLTWRDVFDSTKSWYGYITQAALVASNVEYEYFCWNGRIYKISNPGRHYTGIFTETTYRICDFGNIYDSANL